MIEDLELNTLLPKRTIIWENTTNQSTLKLILTSDFLVEIHLKCQIHQIEHKSDYQVIPTKLDIDHTKLVSSIWYLFNKHTKTR